jgi:hypothetical protein
MTQVVGRSKATAAVRRVDSYRKRFGVGHVYLACYAALPLALTPDLLYRLWANFQQDAKGALLEIPWIAVSDLLLSNLYEEVGEELYEMEDGVREVLLKELRSNSQLGEARLKEVAEFVLAYVEPQLKNPDADTRDLAEVQQWRSLAYLEPERAARSIAQRLARLDHGDRSEWLRMARVVEPLAEPLVGFEPLVDYTRGMAAFVRGRITEAKEQVQKALGGNREVEVAGVKLPLLESLREELQPELPAVESKPSWVNLLLRNRRWAGAGAGLLVIGGSGVYWWQRPQLSNDSVSVNPTPSITPSSPISAPIVSPSLPLPKDEGAIASSPNGEEIATFVGYDNQIVEIRNASGILIATLKGHEKSITTASFSPDRLRIVTASWDNTVRVWDVKTGQEIATIKGQNTVNTASFSPDGLRILTTAYDDNTARVWDAKTGQEIATLKGHENIVNTADFSPDGLRILTTSWDNTARVWDAKTGQEIATLKGHKSNVFAASFSPDGQHIVTASRDRTARVWDTKSGLQLAILKHESSIRTASFSPDGQRILTTSIDEARVWDAKSGQLRVWDTKSGQLINTKSL